jgi:large subunit ribosomal protein L31
MKEGIHPEYPPATVTCACGNTFVTRSTRGDFQVDVCSNCHPFYTGTQKLIDAAGRVDRFRKRYDKKAAPPAAKVEPAKVEPAKVEPAKAEPAKVEAAPAAAEPAPEAKAE